MWGALAVVAVAAGGVVLTGRPAGTPAALPPHGSAMTSDAEAARLLTRWAPTLRLDAREPSGPVSVEAFRAAAVMRPDELDLVRAPRSSPVVYGHVVRDAGRLWLQYWMLWGSNLQDRGIVRTGRHEGDWELVQLVLGADRRPAAATFAQHSWVVACAVRAAPDVWVAHASHAAYPRRGLADRQWPDPDDEALGTGAPLRPRVEPVGAWVRHEGRWGGSRAGWVPGEQSSPRGPAFQPDRRYLEPAALHASARGCDAEPPAHPWWLRALAMAALAGGAVLLVRRLTRR